MDRRYLEALYEVIGSTGVIDFSRLQPDIRLISYTSKFACTETIEVTDTIGGSEIRRFHNSSGSANWHQVVANILLFALYDGYLEEKYGLTEGASFLQHYRELNGTGVIDLIERECYRIMKLIRNAAQHNFSSVRVGEHGYEISFTWRNTDFLLNMSPDAIDDLYAILFALLDYHNEDKRFITEGHFYGELIGRYNALLDDNLTIQDEISSCLQAIDNVDILSLRLGVRYRIENADIVAENEHEIILRYHDNHFEEYAGDYVIQHQNQIYVLPEEAGKIFYESELTEEEQDQLRTYVERYGSEVESNQRKQLLERIRFKKCLFCDKWKLRNV